MPSYIYALLGLKVIMILISTVAVVSMVLWSTSVVS